MFYSATAVIWEICERGERSNSARRILVEKWDWIDKVGCVGSGVGREPLLTDGVDAVKSVGLSSYRYMEVQPL